MGLHTINRRDDPWHYKAYNLYRPIFTGGGTFEEHLKRGRYKRDASRLPHFQNLGSIDFRSNTITLDTRNMLMGLKTYHPKSQSMFYNPAINRDQHTTLNKRQPIITQQPLSYRNIELAVAEINPLESLKDTYGEDLQKILKKQYQQHSHIYEPLRNVYRSEINFKNINEPPYNLPKALQGVPALKSFSPQQNIKKSQQAFLSKKQPDLNNPHENITEHQKLSKEHLLESDSNYWDKLQEVLKNFNESHGVLQNTQDSTSQKPLDISPGSLKLSNDDHNLWNSLNKPSALNKRNSFWTDLEEEEELSELHQQQLDNFEPIFDFDEDFDE